MKKRSLPKFADEEAAEPSQAASEPITGFEDDFSPFVSSSPSRLEEDEAILFGDDTERDPTEQFSALFSSLSSFREQAQNMPDDERRKDFAAEMALRFAKQLDTMLGTEDDDLQEDTARLSIAGRADSA